MNRITLLDPKTATGAGKTLMDGVQAKLGLVPNMMRAMAQAPVALEAYVNFSDALQKGSFSPKLREAIALAVGQANKCQYCVSAHTLIGSKSGLSADEAVAARTAESTDPKTAGVLRLAVAINSRQGHIADADLATARAAGLSDAEIVETVANVALNVYTNWFNHVADPVVDFPVVQL